MLFFLVASVILCSLLWLTRPRSVTSADFHRSKPPPPTSGHAIVIGNGMGGMMAARVLCDFFARVTIVEKDEVAKPTSGLVSRPGVPQSSASHLMLHLGATILRELFGSRYDEVMKQAGAVPLDLAHLYTSLAGIWGKRPKTSSGHVSWSATRPLYESALRLCLSEYPNVSIMSSCTVTSYLGDAACVKGVNFRLKGDSEERALAADLVVDCSGKSALSAKWLNDLGVPAVRSMWFKPDIAYTSMFFRAPQLADGSLVLPECMRDPHSSLPILGCNVYPPEGRPCPNPRYALLFKVEEERWLLSFMSHTTFACAPTLEAMAHFATLFDTPVMSALFKTLQPCAEASPVQYRVPTHKLHLYDELGAAHPANLLIMADALCNLDPVFGQGMSLAAKQAWLLREQLLQCKQSTQQADVCSNARLFNLALTRTRKALRATLEPYFMMCAGEDLRFLHTTHNLTPTQVFSTSALDGYFRLALRASAADAEVQQALGTTFALLRSPLSLLHPFAVGRVLWVNFRLMVANFRH